MIPLQQGVVNDPAHPGFIYFSLKPLPIEGEWPVYFTSEDTTKPNDACEPLPDDTPDLSKFVTIVRRGTCTFVGRFHQVERLSLSFDSRLPNCNTSQQSSNDYCRARKISVVEGYREMEFTIVLSESLAAEDSICDEGGFRRDSCDVVFVSTVCADDTLMHTSG